MNKHLKKVPANLRTEIDLQEMKNVGSSPTNDKEFDRIGYRIVRNICDPELLICPVPEVKGQFTYHGDYNKFSHVPVELQVPGSCARYNYPFFKEAHATVRQNIEKSVGSELYQTYYYDRFYNPGQDLKYHVDRDACEISCTIHISTNLKDGYPILIKTVTGEVIEANLKSGDGLIYKGCERPHWREKMPGVKRNFIRKKLGIEELYYHQIFMHYVLANGRRAHCKGDRR
jgi:hypothetical protein